MAEKDPTAKEQAEKALLTEEKGTAKDGEVQGSNEDGEKDVTEEGHKEEVKEPTAIEKIARDWGHQSREDFEAEPENKGKPWVDAETFVRNQRGISDAYRKRDKDLQRQLDDNNKAIQKMLERQEALDKRAREAEQTAKQNLLKELETQLEAAALEGNKDAVRDINKKIVVLSGEVKAAETKVDDTEAEKSESPEDSTAGGQSATVQRWMGRNEAWYDNLDNPLFAAMTLYADKRSAELGKDNPTWTWEEILNQVDRDVASYRVNAERVMAPAKAIRESSSAGGGSPVSDNKKSTASSLDEDQKKIGSAFVARGLFKTLDEYAASL